MNDFYNRVTIVYKTRLIYLSEYCKRNNISNTFKYLAESEVKSAYYINLLKVYNNESDFHKDAIPSVFDSVLKAVTINDEYLFKRTNLYSKYVSDYIKNYLGSVNLSYQSADSSFYQNYSRIERVARNGIIKDNLLYQCLSLPKNRKSDLFIELAKKFKISCSSVVFVPLIDSIISIKINESKISIFDAMNSKVENDSNRQIVLQKLLGKKPTLIDCWASWCGPCIVQMTFSKEIENEYKGRINFLYFSFDKLKEKWLNKSKALVLKNSFLLQDNFKSSFAQYFNIETIPRYLLIDKSGRIVTIKAPRPSRKNALEKLLDSQLK